MLTNFISNAIKYTNQGKVKIRSLHVQGTSISHQHYLEDALPPHPGVVPLSFSTATEWGTEPAVVVAVADSGRGVPEGKLETIFEVYSQVGLMEASSVKNYYSHGQFRPWLGRLDQGQICIVLH